MECVYHKKKKKEEMEMDGVEVEERVGEDTMRMIGWRVCAVDEKGSRLNLDPSRDALAHLCVCCLFLHSLLE